MWLFAGSNPTKLPDWLKESRNRRACMLRRSRFQKQLRFSVHGGNEIEVFGAEHMQRVEIVSNLPHRRLPLGLMI
jgi:hypothetical protein